MTALTNARPGLPGALLLAGLLWSAPALAAPPPAPAPVEDSGPAAPDPGPTLRKIAERGRIIVAFEPTPPFSFLDRESDTVLGYSIDYAHLIADAVRTALGRPDLAVEYLGVTLQNRFPLLLQGLYDIQCASTTHNVERERTVAFSNTIFIVSTRLLVARDSGIRDFADLRGKTVAVTAGSTSALLLETENRERGLSATALSFVDTEDAFQALEDGRAQAFFIDDPLLARERAHSRTPARWEIVGEPQSSEAIACVLPRDDPAFKQLVDETIAHAQKTGLARGFYDRWFRSPAPPDGVNLDFPMPEAMIELFNAPNDKPFQ